ncbi:MAG: hypothetical protein ACREAC_31310, partial [Blastocatellia bacterium]
AVVWRALLLENYDQVSQKAASSAGQSAQLAVEIKFEDDVLRKLLRRFAALSDAQVDALATHALAKALPYLSDYPVRAQPALRDLCYAPLWAYYLSNPSLDSSVYASIAASTITNNAVTSHIPQASQLANFEKGATADVNDTFGGLIKIEGDSENGDYSAVRDDLGHFKAGLSLLAGAITPGRCGSYTQIDQVFKDIRQFLGQSFYVRAAGIFLLDLASSDPSLLASIDRTFSVVGADKKTTIFSVSVGAQ